MSRRGSRSADFIGGFKKYDYAIDISADYHIVSGSNILAEFLFKLKTDRANPNLRYDEMIKRLKEIRYFLDLIKNSNFNERIDKLSAIQRIKNDRKALKKSNYLKPQFDELIDDVIHTLSKKNQEIIQESSKKAVDNFVPRIKFVEDGALYKMNIGALNDYLANLKKEFDGLYLKFIKKPSLNHLFDAAARSAGNPKRLRTLLILLQRDIRDLEHTNFKVGQSKKGW